MRRIQVIFESPRRRLLLIVGAAMLLVACGSAAVSSTPEADPTPTAGTEAPSESAEPSIAPNATQMHGNESFGKDEITIAAGESAIFINAGSGDHTVTEGRNGRKKDGARFDVVLPGHETIEVPFEETGDYDVTCRYHAGMNMIVLVE